MDIYFPWTEGCAQQAEQEHEEKLPFKARETSIDAVHKYTLFKENKKQVCLPLVWPWNEVKNPPYLYK